MIQALKKANNDVFLEEEIGMIIIEKNILSFIIASFLADFGAFFHEIEHEKKTYTGLLKTIKTIASWISHMDESFKKLHYDYYISNDKFVNELAFLEGRITTQQEYKEEIALSFLEKNYFCFESYKNLYARLLSFQAKDLARFLHEKNHQFYLEHSYSLAKFYLSVQDYMTAKEVLLQMKKTHKKDDFILWLLIKVDYELQDYKEVIRQSKDLLETAEHKETIYNLIGVSYGKMQKFKDAVSVYEKGIAMYPFSHKLHHNLFLAYKALGRYQEAKKIMKRAEALKK